MLYKKQIIFQDTGVQPGQFLADRHALFVLFFFNIFWLEEFTIRQITLPVIWSLFSYINNLFWQGKFKATSKIW